MPLSDEVQWLRPAQIWGEGVQLFKNMSAEHHLLQEADLGKLKKGAADDGWFRAVLAAASLLVRLPTG